MGIKCETPLFRSKTLGLFRSSYLYENVTVGFGYRTTGIATTHIVQVPAFVCGLGII
jgi:hypothetical protein